MGKILDLVLAFVDRVPLERLIVRTRDTSKDRNELKQVLLDAQKETHIAQQPNAATQPPLPQRKEQPKTVHLSPEDLPSTSETVAELKRRLGRELYRMELDLQSGARIAGKPCDCLTESKHSGAVVAIAEELMSYEAKLVYGQVVDWIKAHIAEFEPSVIVTHELDYYRAMTPQVRTLRKEIMGTEKLAALLNPAEKARAIEMVKQKLEGVSPNVSA